MNVSNWKIKHDCPQCGAPVVLNETDRLLLCPYCRTKLYLIADDYFRYYIPPPDSASGGIIYIPYWRLKGLSYFLRDGKVSHRFVDTNFLALNQQQTQTVSMASGIFNFPDIPPSLGLRPQVFTLKFVSPETQGRFLDPQCHVENVMTNTSGHVWFIGETVSIIYSPMYLENNILHDALLKRPVGTIRNQNEFTASTPSQTWSVAFLSTLCPWCGWDIQGEKDSLILICRNCNSAWGCRRKAFEKVEFAVLEGADQASHYLPFWKMKATIEGISLETYADLIRKGNLPKAVTDAHRKTPLYFWSPAFKVNPALFLRWARQMTIFQPGGKEGDTFPGASIYPVTLSIGEAEKSILITMVDIVKDKGSIFSSHSGFRITLDEFRLVYHPFIAKHNELIHATMNLSMDRRSLAYGVNL